jgi:outer membrane protein OmpA-like peptidoglycan-associated protein
VNAGIERADRVRAGAEDKYKETTAEELAKARAELEAGKRQLESERSARIALEKRLKAAIESLAAVAAIKEEARGVVITLSGAVLFASGKSKLLPIAKQKLNQVAATLKAEGNPELIVEGHTDASGPRRMNMALSQKRADAVAAHLMSRGYPATKIKAVGVGPDRPVAKNTSAEGRANNRRVEIVVTK